MDRSEHIKIWEKRIAEFKASSLSVPNGVRSRMAFMIIQLVSKTKKMITFIVKNCIYLIAGVNVSMQIIIIPIYLVSD
ncbi:hypothetical protein ACE1TI_18660 [Alteribacillus sp. JSM 102045]|uniref:hypothetical protein n=1 Tax=Alteribacillus sp. JSM 102045 TaxID=1562101 RepID=UPI0035BF0F19